MTFRHDGRLPILSPRLIQRCCPIEFRFFYSICLAIDSYLMGEIYVLVYRVCRGKKGSLHKHERRTWCPNRSSQFKLRQDVTLWIVAEREKSIELLSFPLDSLPGACLPMWPLALHALEYKPVI